MKLLLFLLGGLLSGTTALAPPAVRVALSPLTKAAYLAAQKSCVGAKPRVTFPLRKRHGRLVIPTAKGARVYQDKYVGTENANEQRFEYAGYLPAVQTHLVIGYFWEQTSYILLSQSGERVTLDDKPIYAPNGQGLVVVSRGLEYGRPNAIRLFRYKASGWREVWHIQPKTWEPDSICWASDTTLLLRQRQWPSERHTYTQLTIGK